MPYNNKFKWHFFFLLFICAEVPFRVINFNFYDKQKINSKWFNCLLKAFFFSFYSNNNAIGCLFVTWFVITVTNAHFFIIISFVYLHYRFQFSASSMQSISPENFIDCEKMDIYANWRNKQTTVGYVSPNSKLYVKV